MTNNVIEEDEASMAEKISEATMSLTNLLTEQERELEPELRIERLCETIKLMLRASQSDQEVKDVLKFGTSLLFLLCK